MKKLVLLGAALASFSLSSPAQADVEKYSFDKVHTQIFFSVNHLGFSNSTGKFIDFDGGFTFDTTEPAKSAVNVTIQTKSIETDNQEWNDHLKASGFFNVEKFPEMSFKSTAIEVTGEKTANITGDLTLLGVTKPVVLAVTHNKSAKHDFSGKFVSGFSATATLKRSEFGMNTIIPMVSDDVQIKIEVEGVRDGGAADTAGNQ